MLTEQEKDELAERVLEKEKSDTGHKNMLFWTVVGGIISVIMFLIYIGAATR